MVSITDMAAADKIGIPIEGKLIAIKAIVPNGYMEVNTTLPVVVAESYLEYLPV